MTVKYILMLAVLLAACSDSGVKPAPKAKRESPKFQYHTRGVDGNELITIDLPDYQRCYVWRDQEFKTASMQCPADSAFELPVTGSMDTGPRY